LKRNCRGQKLLWLPGGHYLRSHKDHAGSLYAVAVIDRTRSEKLDGLVGRRSGDRGGVGGVFAQNTPVSRNLSPYWKSPRAKAVPDRPGSAPWQAVSMKLRLQSIACAFASRSPKLTMLAAERRKHDEIAWLAMVAVRDLMR
jgi:hypothetical protein